MNEFRREVSDIGTYDIELHVLMRFCITHVILLY